MARAKRTARAEARRRYRADQNLTDGSDAVDDALEPASAAGSRTGPAARPTPGGAPRIGIFTAVRQAFRPLDVRADLAALPSLATRSKALWLPILLVLGTTVGLAVTQGKDVVSQFMAAYFVQAPAIGGVFLAGFLAPRASWLLGVIVGIVSAICYAIAILFFPSAFAAVQPTADQARDAIIAGFILSPIMGAFFAAAAAWYRRFLQLSNPNRGRATQGKPGRGDGRARTAGSRKEPARR